MGLTYQPRLWTVVQCDFAGMVVPEMVKKRDVVVIARNKHNSQLVTVVPLSTTEPDRVEDYHHVLERNPRPDGDRHTKVWAKCDMLYTVSLARLELYYTRTRRGGRQYVSPTLSVADQAEAMRAVCAALSIRMA
ncbi:type II toxin-antitoxin system PemK/MazF family toxin [Burkholderia multivorans]|uniref:type II toxin-antitoxin system PemK/MazF family toxin n=1 Tax=Burkholderia multivorans TaxID=87883 RepID=UPI00209EDEE7|nr:type II toxin-antitoxin system PemK/MazF family toxin [Burkholderia multivorans]MCO8590373.1 type II toxin-antitoxin system PemK/MazF family toxin [Burkholderia multivorans]MCO8632648.1 type II toxin-antitoxin system PemK/MazF family toxin [Burkholderia multivorans]MCO8647215.1 type II toxin-antitoxin system PemK/MazF family toxin [Burkholderia multivorans]